MDILFREGSAKKINELPKETVKDLAIDEIIDYMTDVSEDAKILKHIITRLPADLSDMRYRQDILKDLMNSDELCEDLRSMIDHIKVLKYYRGVKNAQRDDSDSLFSLLEQLRELSSYVDIIDALGRTLSGHEITSEGLVALRDHIKSIEADPDYQKVKPDIIKIHEDLSNVRGALVGVNFTPDLNVSEVSIVEFLPCATVPKYNIVDMLTGTAPLTGGTMKKTDPLMASMAPRLEKHLRKQYLAMKKTMTRYSGYDSRFLIEMYEGLLFYISAATLGKKLRSRGYEISFPDLTPSDDHLIRMEDLYNIRLAIAGEKEIVKNDMEFTDKEKMFILTGPNRGGKTVIEQALGIISIMASSGMFVTAKHFSGVPFAKIYTHFPIDENLTINYGRLGEEAVRIKEIVKSSDKDTLILFNETFSTTSAADALYLSKDLLHILKDKGSSVIFNTHIHELAQDIPGMNKWDGESDIVSIVMEIRDNVNTFKIKRSAPDTSSYASNIARKYGITYEQMSDLIPT